MKSKYSYKRKEGELTPTEDEKASNQARRDWRGVVLNQDMQEVTGR